MLAREVPMTTKYTKLLDGYVPTQEASLVRIMALFIVRATRADCMVLSLVATVTLSSQC